MISDETLATQVRVIMPRDALIAVFNECDRYDHDETGGRLLGVYKQNKDTLEITVTGIIEPGPNARRSANSFFQDGDYQARVFRKLESKYPDVEHLGNWHTHHVNGYPMLSGGDRETYHRIVDHAQHNTDFFYALLVTARNAGQRGIERYRVRHYLLRQGDPTVYEVSADNVTIVGERCIWPELADSPSSTVTKQPARDTRAQDQAIFGELYPDLQPFLSKRSQALSWKGRLALIDDSSVDVRIVEVEGDDYRVLIKNPPKGLEVIAEEIANASGQSAAHALRQAECVINRRLYQSRNVS